jgi:hypothetical protein
MNSLNAPNVFLRNDLMDDLFGRKAKSDIRSELIAAKLNRLRHMIRPHAYAIGFPRKWFELKAKGNLFRLIVSNGRVVRRAFFLSALPRLAMSRYAQRHSR